MSFKFTNLILRHLPIGKAWNKEGSSNLSKLAKGLSLEFQRIEDRANQLISESEPQTCSESLEDWERVFGLPEECDTDIESTVERKLKLVNKAFSLIGGQSAKFFKDYVASLGFESEVKEIKEFRAGLSCAGDYSANGIEWVNCWEMILPATISYEFSAGVSTAGEALRVFRNDSVECALNHIKPAHSKLFILFNT